MTPKGPSCIQGQEGSSLSPAQAVTRDDKRTPRVPAPEAYHGERRRLRLFGIPMDDVAPERISKGWASEASRADRANAKFNARPWLYKPGKRDHNEADWIRAGTPAGGVMPRMPQRPPPPVNRQTGKREELRPSDGCRGW